MAFNINMWIEQITNKLKISFSDRLLFVGLQGSYNRNEVAEESDIDIVVILDELNFQDIKIYKKIINEMPYNEKACGFISGKMELTDWSKPDLFQFFYDTKPIYGNLSDIIHPPSKDDIRKALKSGFENIYHSAVHSFLHSTDYKNDLMNIYKMTFFVLQAKYFIEKDIYMPTKNKLYENLQNIDKEILNTCINRKYITEKNEKEIENLYNKLIIWSKSNL